MKHLVLPTTFLLGTILAAGCMDSPTSTDASAVEPSFKVSGGTTTAVHHWKFPTPAEDTLGLRSDGISTYVKDGYNVYKHGVCGVSATFQSAGDATMQTNNPNYRDRKCPDYPRKIKLVYRSDDPDMPDKTEIMEAFFNLDNARDIPVDPTVTVKRAFNLNPTQTTRCDAWRWRAVTVDGVEIKGDSVLVTRLDTKTWHVRTSAYPDNKAVCTPTGRIHHLAVDFRIVVE